MGFDPDLYEPGSDNPDDLRASQLAQRRDRRNTAPPPPDPIRGAAKVIPASTSSAIDVPANMYQWIHDAAQSYGVPEALLIAILQQESGIRALGSKSDNINKNGSRDRGIAQINNRAHPDITDEQAYDPEFAINWAAQFVRGLWDDQRIEGSGDARWKNVAAAYNGGVGGYKGAGAQAYGNSVFSLSRAPGITVSGNVSTDASGGTAPLIPGLTDEQAAAARRVADTAYIKYLGRFPTNDEYVGIVNGKFTPQSLEAHLRAQPLEGGGPGMTLGRIGDLRGLADKYAQANYGRDATEGEINWLATNNIPASDDHIGAFYEQMRTNSVWKGDPKAWLTARADLQRTWSSLGLTGDVDPNLVNEQVTSGRTVDQMADRIRALPAPGYGGGTTVGDVERLRALATGVKKDLMPGDAVTDSELHHLLGMTPDQVNQYYRAQIPKNSTTGLPAGVEGDYRKLAGSLLSKYGVSGYDLTPEDLRYFALTKADPSSILEHLASNPALAGAFPGLAYGMDTESYKRQVAALNEAYGGAFPGQSLAAPRPGAPKGERDQSLLGYALGEGIAPSELGGVSEQFRQERGRAPSTAEFKERRTRPTSARSSGAGASVSLQTPDPAAERGTPRPAVGARA